MYYIVLFIILCILAIIYYNLFGKDVLSPSFITCCTYAISSLAAYISYDNASSWNYVELKSKTVIYILIGIICFSIGELIVKFFSVKKERDGEKINYIKIDFLKNILCVCFIVITFFLIYIQMISLTGQTSFSKIIVEYKIHSAMYNADKVYKISSLYIQMYRISIVIGYIYLYTFINNMIYNRKNKKNIFYLIPVIIAMILAILLGGRSSIVQYIIAAIFFYIILKNKVKKIMLGKFIIIGCLCLIIILPLFYFLLKVIGQTTRVNFVDYITFYLGCPLPCFDIFLSNPILKSEHFGENIFIGIQQILHKFNIIDYYNIYQADWIRFGNGLSSNVYSGFKVYIQDFGLIGLIFFQILYGFTFAKLYDWAKTKDSRFLIFYGIISINLIDQIRTEKLFSSIIRIDKIVYIVCICFFVWFLYRLRIIYRKR